MPSSRRRVFNRKWCALEIYAKRRRRNHIHNKIAKNYSFFFCTFSPNNFVDIICFSFVVSVLLCVIPYVCVCVWCVCMWLLLRFANVVYSRVTLMFRFYRTNAKKKKKKFWRKYKIYRYCLNKSERGQIGISNVYRYILVFALASALSSASACQLKKRVRKKGVRVALTEYRNERQQQRQQQQKLKENL